MHIIMKKKILIPQNVSTLSHHILSSLLNCSDLINQDSSQNTQRNFVNQKKLKRKSTSISLQVLQNYEEPMKPTKQLVQEDKNSKKSSEEMKPKILKIQFKSLETKRNGSVETIASKKTLACSRISGQSSYNNTFYPKKQHLKSNYRKLQRIQKIPIRKIKSQESKIIDKLRLDWLNKNQETLIPPKKFKSRSYFKLNNDKSNKKKESLIIDDPNNLFIIKKLEYQLLDHKNEMNKVKPKLNEQNNRKGIEFKENRSESLKKYKKNYLHYKHLNQNNIAVTKQNTQKLKINQYRPLINKLNIHNLNLYHQMLKAQCPKQKQEQVKRHSRQFTLKRISLYKNEVK